MFLMVSEIPKDVEIQRQLTSIHIEEWMKDDVFSLRWWLLIGLILLFLLAWWKAADKPLFRDVCMFTVLTTIITMGINEYGEELTLWYYPTDVIPIFPPLSSINLISLPLIYSIVYQYFKSRRSFIGAVLVTTAVFCFIIEPVLVWAGLYQLIKWKHIYSYPIYAAMAIGIREIMLKISDINEKHKTKIKSTKSNPANK
jgi:hypothetical protein